MLELAVTAGVSVSEFWELTPFELNATIKGYVKRREQEQKENIYQAYLISRWVWTKKVDIDKVLGESTKQEKKDMSEEEMMEQVRKLNLLFGGTEETCNP